MGTMILPNGKTKQGEWKNGKRLHWFCDGTNNNETIVDLDNLVFYQKGSLWKNNIDSIINSKNCKWEKIDSQEPGL